MGLQYNYELQRRHPSSEAFKEKYQEGRKEPLFEKAHYYLRTAQKLPDDFSIREKVLNLSARMEWIKGDYDKAIGLVEEMGKKYPRGKYGKSAEKMKKQLQELKQKEAKEGTREK